MAFICKNYRTDGGNELVIGGKITFKKGAKVDNLPPAALPAATKTVKGAVKMAAKVSEAAGSAPTAAEFKALLDALKAAGIMSST